MRITFDEDDAVIVAKTMAKSRKLECDFEKPFSPESVEAEIYSEALRVVAALKQEAQK